VVGKQLQSYATTRDGTRRIWVRAEPPHSHNPTSILPITRTQTYQRVQKISIPVTRQGKWVHVGKNIRLYNISN
jgi:hypothetical protein